MKTVSLLFYFLMPISVFGGQDAAAPLDQGDMTELENRVTTSIAAARRDLHSGSFRAMGVVTRMDHRSSKQVELPRECECIFDSNRGLYRYVFRGEEMIQLESSEEEFDTPTQEASLTVDAARPRAILSMIVQSPEYMFQWSGIGKYNGNETLARDNILLQPRNTPVVDLYNIVLHPELAGLVEADSFGRFRRVEDAFRYFHSHPRATVVSARETDGGMLEVVYEAAHARRTITIDAANGFTVERMMVAPLDDRKEAVLDGERFDAAAEWKNVGDVWVPIRMSSRAVVPNLNEVRWEYSIDWTSVNPLPESIDESLFTYQSLAGEGIWPGVQVYDSRGGEPVHIDTIGKDVVKVYSPSELDTAKSAIERHDVTDRNSLLWVVVATGVAMLVVLLSVLFRRRRVTG